MTKQMMAQALAMSEPSVAYGEQNPGYWERQYMAFRKSVLIEKVLKRIDRMTDPTAPRWMGSDTDAALDFLSESIGL